MLKSILFNKQITWEFLTHFPNGCWKGFIWVCPGIVLPSTQWPPCKLNKFRPIQCKTVAKIRLTMENESHSAAQCPSLLTHVFLSLVHANIPVVFQLLLVGVSREARFASAECPECLNPKFNAFQCEACEMDLVKCIFQARPAASSMAMVQYQPSEGRCTS